MAWGLGFGEERYAFGWCRVCMTCWQCVAEPGAGAGPRLQAAAGAVVEGVGFGHGAQEHARTAVPTLERQIIHTMQNFKCAVPLVHDRKVYQ